MDRDDRSAELESEMKKVKSDFRILSRDIIEDMLKDLTSAEKETLLRLYIYENR